MNTRTIQSTVMFLYPFRLQGMAGPQPAGLYRLIADQEQHKGVAFTTYRTVMAVLEVPALGTGEPETCRVQIDLAELAACVRADRLAASNPALQEPAVMGHAQRENA